MDDFLSPAEVDSLGLRAGRQTRISRDARFFGAERIEIGDHCRVDAFCLLSSGSSGYIRIGDWVHVASASRLFGGSGIELHDFSSVSAGVSIFSDSDDYMGFSMVGAQIPGHLRKVISRKVTFSRHAAVGAHAVVLPGCDLGEGTVLGAASVASARLNEWTIYRGNPATQVGIRKRNPLDLERRIEI